MNLIETLRRDAEIMRKENSDPMIADLLVMAANDLSDAYKKLEMKEQSYGEKRIADLQAAYTAAKSEADLYADKLTKAERHRINAEQNSAPSTNPQQRRRLSRLMKILLRLQQALHLRLLRTPLNPPTSRR